MTNEQKAVTIITKDGWIFEPKEDMWQHEEHATSHIEWLTKLYITDLNYLVPVAVKVRREISLLQYNKAYDLLVRLQYQMATYDKTPENTYQPLFDAVHEAIVYLENQNA